MLAIRETAVGRVGVVERGGAVARVLFGADPVPDREPVATSRLLRRALDEIERYLARELAVFTLPLAPEGTPFQRRVWDLVAAIPYGVTVTRRALAEAAGFPGAARAVARACRDNPLPLLVPCHRVLDPAGSRAGRSGTAPSPLRRYLLDLERGRPAAIPFPPASRPRRAM